MTPFTSTYKYESNQWTFGYWRSILSTEQSSPQTITIMLFHQLKREEHTEAKGKNRIVREVVDLYLSKVVATGYDLAVYSETQITWIAKRVDGRGNREGRYISSHDSLIGLSKSLPPLHLQLSSVVHHPSTSNGPPPPSIYELVDQWDWLLP